jgi:hypothetical protein
MAFELNDLHDVVSKAHDNALEMRDASEYPVTDAYYAGFISACNLVLSLIYCVEYEQPYAETTTIVPLHPSVPSPKKEE